MGRRDTRPTRPGRARWPIVAGILAMVMVGVGLRGAFLVPLGAGDDPGQSLGDPSQAGPQGLPLPPSRPGRGPVADAGAVIPTEVRDRDPSWLGSRRNGLDPGRPVLDGQRLRAVRRRPADPPGRGRRLLDGPDARHQRPVRPVRPATGYVTVAERKPDPKDFPGVPPEDSCPARWSSRRPTARPARRHSAGGAMSPGPTGAPRGAGQRLDGPRGPPGRPGRLGRRRRLRAVGRQAAADRGGVGVRRPGRADAASPTPGATSSGPSGGGWRTPGRGGSPTRTATRTASPRTSPGRLLPAQRLRPATTWRATSGSGAPTGIGPTTYAPQPPSQPDRPRRQLRPRRAGRAQAGPARRVVPVHATSIARVTCPAAGARGP